jgi:hypothetical protein
MSRAFIVKKIQLDDYFIIAAWVRIIRHVDGSIWRLTRRQIVGFGLSFSICFGSFVGLGRHDVDVPPQWEAPLKKSEYAFSVLYVSEYGFVESVCGN